RVLAALDVGIAPPRSVRRTGVAPRTVRVGSVLAELPAVVTQEVAEVGDGRVAVLAPAAQVDSLVEAGIPGVPGVVGAGDIDAQVTVLSVAQAKGLEFDAVVLVDPAAMLAESPRGRNDLYVALTRATQRLTIVHPGDLPDVLKAS
ncbi:MAG TPA: ATP-binding domain-containing protein, partial [Pseudonocardiaceae bacterium]